MCLNNVCLFTFSIQYVYQCWKAARLADTILEGVEDPDELDGHSNEFNEPEVLKVRVHNEIGLIWNIYCEIRIKKWVFVVLSLYVVDVHIRVSNFGDVIPNQALLVINKYLWSIFLCIHVSHKPF